MSEPSSWAERLQAGHGAQYWATNTRLMLRDAQACRGRDLQAKLRDLTYWCEESVTTPEAIDADIFAEFVQHFSRVAGNYGAVDGADVERALDKVINLQQHRGEPTTQLWLAMARYRSKISLEDQERERALDEAMTSAVGGTELWAEAILEYTWYLIDISKYDRALRVAARLQRELSDDLFTQKYRCGFHAMSGVALFTSFQDLRRARRHLLEACAYEDAGQADPQILRWVATAHHYLGRIAEVDKRYREALASYVRGQSIQERCPEDLRALAFLHIRLSEPLISMGAFDQARDHLDWALAHFADSAEHSSGRLQAHLGFATLSAALGDLDDAMRIVEITREQVRQIGFWRGELLCLGYRLSLLVRARRYRHIPGTIVDITRTLRGGELGRNNAVRLLMRIPVVLGVAIRRMAHRSKREASTAEVDHCPCPLHAEAAATRAQSAMPSDSYSSPGS
jgi:tetratricopeptide (TPR) repeat protein